MADFDFTSRFAIPSQRLHLGLGLGLAALLLAISVAGCFGIDGVEPTPTTRSALPSLTESVPPSGPTALASPTGVPSRIDGERVYLISERSEWEILTGSFLLQVTPVPTVISCFAQQVSNIPAERDLLVPTCGDHLGIGTELGSTASSSYAGGIIFAAPKSPAMYSLDDWNGQPVVVRAHTHDGEASGCSAAQRAACDAAVVIEAIVWPSEPSPTGSAATGSPLPPGGISEERAVQLAAEHEANPVFLSASAGPFAEVNAITNLGPGWDPSRLLWAIRFDVSGGEACPPPQPSGPTQHCELLGPRAVMVILDYYTGDFIVAASAIDS